MTENGMSTSNDRPDDKMRPNLPLTVSGALWRAMVLRVRPTFADSYLSGAKQTAKHLSPHTVTAYQRLRDSREAMQVFAEFGLKLVKPLPFGHPDRPDALTAR